MIGTVIQGRYRIESELGQGGMGIVYRAHDTVLDRDVALKMVHGVRLGTEGRARLLSEARAVARLNHPNVVSVYDASEQEGTPFIVMELVEGQSLRDRPPRDLAEIVAVARQVCAALAHAHAHGVIHRDIKPENVLLAPNQAGNGVDTAKLMDFGLARTVASRLTAEGSVIGTVFYLAPEQAVGTGTELDGRADLYALGVLLYELVAGRLPFVADDPLAIISQHLYAPVIPPASFRPDLPAALEAVILKLLAKQPQERYASAQDVSQALAEAVQAMPEPGVSATGGPGSLLEQLGHGRLIGRQGELEELRGLWSQARQGQGRLALLSGEPGVGKTRLAREMMVHARLNGAAVLQGGCYEYEMAAPYLPYVEALRAWVHAQSDEALRRHLGPLAAELARLAPEIEARIGPLPPNPPLSPEEERLRLFDHVARFFQGLAAECSLVFFIDDLQWADRGSLALLRYLLRALRHDRALILAAYRETDLDRAHPLAAALVEWNRERLASRVRLGRLGPEETATLLATLFGAEQVTSEFAEAVYGETEGNPFFVEEVVKALIEQGQVYRQEGHWERREIAELAIPQSIKEAIGRRLSRLSAGCLDALHTAAPLGKVFPFRELAAVSARGEDDLLDALDEAAAAQLIRPEPGEQFTFTHDKIREVLYEELNPVRQRRLHQRIGESLERLYAADPGSHVQALAYHFVRGGDQPRALRYLLQAAEQAGRLYAQEEALDHYDQALELAQMLGETAQVAGIHEAMARVYAARGPAHMAIQHYEAILALAPLAAERARLRTQIGAVYANVGDSRGLDILQSAVEELDAEAQPNDVALGLAAIGRFHHYQARHRTALEFLERARQLAEPQDDPATLESIYGYLAGAFQHLARLEESMTWARHSIALAERRGYPPAAGTGYEFLAEDSALLGRWEEALRYARLDLEIGEQTGSQFRVAWSGFSEAYARYGRGDLAAAAEVASRTLSMAERIGDLRLAVWGGVTLAQAQTDLGPDDQARTAATLALARANELNQPLMQCMGRHGLAYFYLRRQEWERAAALYDECAALIAPTDNRIFLLQAWTCAAEAYCGRGRLDEARRAITTHLELAQYAGAEHWTAAGRRVQAQVQAAQGDAAGARASLDLAIDPLRRLGSRLELARALDQRARMLEARGEADAAGADRDEALALWSEMGGAAGAILAGG